MTQVSHLFCIKIKINFRPCIRTGGKLDFQERPPLKPTVKRGSLRRHVPSHRIVKNDDGFLELESNISLYTKFKSVLQLPSVTDTTGETFKGTLDIFFF